MGAQKGALKRPQGKFLPAGTFFTVNSERSSFLSFSRGFLHHLFLQLQMFLRFFKNLGAGTSEILVGFWGQNLKPGGCVNRHFFFFSTGLRGVTHLFLKEQGTDLISF